MQGIQINFLNIKFNNILLIRGLIQCLTTLLMVFELTQQVLLKKRTTLRC